MKQHFTAFLSITAAFALMVGLPVVASAERAPESGTTTESTTPSTEATTPPDPGTSDLGDLGLPSTDTESTTSDESGLDKVGNFVSDNAAWFIIGVVVLAAIIAGILIMRARRRGKSKAPAATSSAATAAGAAAATKPPTASEMKRRKRAAMQRAREEERLRRKSGGQPPAPRAVPPVDPVAAEKEAARTAAVSPPAPGQAPAGSPGEAVTEVTGQAEGVSAPGVAATAAGTAAAAGIAAATGADAEQRLREKVAEIKASQEAGMSLTGEPVGPQTIQPPIPGEEPPPLSGGLAAAERRLRADGQARERKLQDAEERLRSVERKAEDAERRAAFAEHLAELKIEEGERERRLQDVLVGIEEAERRAEEAERKAEEAERRAAAALEQATPTPPPAAISQDKIDRESEPVGGEQPDPKAQVVPDTASPPPVSPGVQVDLNIASFEELREADLSVTQATRVLAYRERFGGYESVDDLTKVPGFSEEMVTGLRARFRV